MKYTINYLWLSDRRKINEWFADKKKFTIESVVNCQLQLSTYIDNFCHLDFIVQKNREYTWNTQSDMIVIMLDQVAFFVVNFDGIRETMIFYHLPLYLFNLPLDYHRWQWGDKNKQLLQSSTLDSEIHTDITNGGTTYIPPPGLILIPNLNNDKKYYFRLGLKKFKILEQKFVKNNKLRYSKSIYVPSSINFKFYMDTRAPITIYDNDGNIIFGEDKQNNSYIEISPMLDVNKDYYVTCNDVISRKTHAIVRLLVGVYDYNQLLYSDYIVFRIAPAILTPNNLKAETVYVSSVGGVQDNKSFVNSAKTILKKEGYPLVVIHDKNMSMYHRWVQDILKFSYCTDGQKTQYMILKGPHFSTQSNRNASIKYIYDYFKNYPLYDFGYETDKNLDSFGNVQVMPPIEPDYPFGRIIYGTSITPGQHNISYNLVDFLEAQEIQKPIHVNTGWLSVGHVDEILSYVPDPKHRYGFRILIASPKKFRELISKMEKNTLIFDNQNNYYIFDGNVVPNEVAKRFSHKYKEDEGYRCVFNTKLTVEKILDWDELKEANEEYQKYLDDNRAILMKELNLKKEDFYEVPVYYWPKSISKRARSIIPNMINNLYIEPIMLVPKPYGPQINGKDVFEEYFKSVVPNETRVYFVKNWDSYYLLEGDINCGTNTKRELFEKAWWSVMPKGEYNI